MILMQFSLKLKYLILLTSFIFQVSFDVCHTGRTGHAPNLDEAFRVSISDAASLGGFFV